MSSLALLYQELFRVCANGCIPNLKFLSALLNQHSSDEGKIYHHIEDAMTWGPTAGGKVRMVASKFRDIAVDQDKFDRVMSKAWVGTSK